MLVHKLKPHPFVSIPDCLLQSDGNSTYCAWTMSKVFGEFYQKLYNCLHTNLNSQFTQEKCNTFIASLQLPTISPDNRFMLNAPITVEEITEVIRHLPSHKSPGPDGLPYSYYKTFLQTLAPHMVNLFSFLMTGNTPHTLFLHAFITVIPKPDKDPTIPDNYSPIALLNLDYKIFTKILAIDCPYCSLS